jgi:hypothetical protein
VQTWKKILACAAELFAARCFGRVTVSDIAPRAGVSLKAIFASVGSKVTLRKRSSLEGARSRVTRRRWHACWLRVVVLYRDTEATLY